MAIRFSDVAGTPVEGAAGSSRPMQRRSVVFTSPEQEREKQAASAEALRQARLANPNAYSTRDPNAAYTATGGGQIGYSENHLDVANQMNETAWRLASGQNIPLQDGSFMTPENYYRRLADQGDALGVARQQALTNEGSKRVGLGKIASYQPWLANVQDQASGKHAAQSLGSAYTATRQVQQAGQAMGGTIAQYQNAAEGRVPSVAEMQMQRGVSDAARMQVGAASAVRGGGAAAFRSAAAAGAGMMQRGIGDASMLRANEMATARDGLLRAQQSQAAVFDQVAGRQAALDSTALASRQAGVTNLGQAASFEHGVNTQGLNADQMALQRYIDAYLNSQNLAHGHSASVGNSENQLVAARMQSDAQKDAAVIGAGAAALGTLSQM